MNYVTAQALPSKARHHARTDAWSMLRRLFIGLMAAAVAMIPNHLEAKSGNHEAGKVYEYEYLDEAHAACGNWSQNAIFY